MSSIPMTAAPLSDRPAAAVHVCAIPAPGSAHAAPEGLRSAGLFSNTVLTEVNAARRPLKPPDRTSG